MWTTLFWETWRLIWRTWIRIDHFIFPLPSTTPDPRTPDPTLGSWCSSFNWSVTSQTANYQPRPHQTNCLNPLISNRETFNPSRVIQLQDSEAETFTFYRKGMGSMRKVTSQDSATLSCAEDNVGFNGFCGNKWLIFLTNFMTDVKYFTLN